MTLTVRHLPHLSVRSQLEYFPSLYYEQPAFDDLYYAIDSER